MILKSLKTRVDFSRFNRRRETVFSFMADLPISAESSRTKFEAVALPFMRRIYSAALSLTHNREDAGDLVQETYLRAYRTFANFTEGTNCKAWLFTIMYSVFVNRYRKEQREPESISVDELEEKFHHSVVAAEWDPDSVVMDGEVVQALNKLPENFRLAVLMVDVEEMSYEEAAAILNCPLGTLRSRLFRARKLLFLELQPYAQKKGYAKRSHQV
jgi:RNA polymerase sigma-70 factor (ECF subfamily)